jgi:hypothetical protein
MELKKAIYTIEEAASLLATLPEKLIERVAAEDFDLYVHVPQGLDVYNVGRSETRYYVPPKDRREWRSDGPQACLVPGIAFLGIPSEGIRRLAKGKVFREFAFPVAGLIDENGDMIRLLPSTPPFNGRHYGKYLYQRDFVAYSSGISDIYSENAIKHPEELKIRLKDVLIPRLAIKELATTKTISPRTIDEPATGYLIDFPDVKEPYVGRKLKILHEVFHRIWIDLESGNFIKINSNDVYEILHKEFEFRAHMAKFGVQVILNDVECKRDSNTGALHVHAEMLQKLIEASRELWKPSPGQLMPNHSNKDVEEWFADFEWSADAASKGATIIRPDYLKKGRRPNSP